MCCEELKQTEELYISRYNRVWNSTNKTVLFCKGCIDGIFSEYVAKHGEITALGVIHLARRQVTEICLKSRNNRSFSSSRKFKIHKKFK